MNKWNVFVMFFLTVSFSSAFSAENNIYSIDSYHMGITGEAIEGLDYSGRDALTYQQAGTEDAESDSFSLNLGWFKRLVDAVEEVSGSTGGGAVQRVQFDVQILEFESPVNVGEFFDFEYFVKGVGNINSDVTIDFWIEDNGTVITSGSDVIFMGSYDEINETGSLFLPEDVETGRYKFVVRASFENVRGEAHREIGVVVEEGVAEIKRLFDISFSLEDAVLEKSDDLIAIMTFENFGNVPTRVDLTFVVLDIFGDEVYKEDSDIMVITEEVLRKKFLGLDLEDGKYNFVLHTLYDVNVSDEFSQSFSVESGKGFDYSVLIIGIVIIVLLIILLIILFVLFLGCRFAFSKCKDELEKRRKRRPSKVRAPFFGGRVVKKVKAIKRERKTEKKKVKKKRVVKEKRVMKKKTRGDFRDEISKIKKMGDMV